MKQDAHRRIINMLYPKVTYMSLEVKFLLTWYDKFSGNIRLLVDVVIRCIIHGSYCHYEILQEMNVICNIRGNAISFTERKMCGIANELWALVFAKSRFKK